MRLIKPSYSIIPQEKGLEGIYKNIELAARNCYKSEPVEGITSKDFVDRMIKSKHLSTLEHGTVYLKMSNGLVRGIQPCQEWSLKYKDNPYSKVSIGRVDKEDEETIVSAYVTTNYRVLIENGWLDDLKYLCNPTEFHEKRVTVKFTSNIHFYKDLTRHRRMSFAIESTRYCNYSKNKFGNELTFIIPVWLSNLDEGSYVERLISNYRGDGEIANLIEALGHNKFWGVTDSQEGRFLCSCIWDERYYLDLIENWGWTAQQAAEVLPQATKADIIVTGFVSDWQHIFNLRTSIIAETGQPHPELARLMDPLFKEFKERKLI